MGEPRTTPWWERFDAFYIYLVRWVLLAAAVWLTASGEWRAGWVVAFCVRRR